MTRKPDTEKFLKLFFNPGEEICFSANEYGYPSESQDNLNEDTTVLVAINPIKGSSRCDANVTSFRTFMIECDDMALEDQLKYVKSMGFPYNYAVYSGGKSIHFGLVLDQDMPNDKIYRFTYQWILNIMSKADQKTKNPSRSIRFPGVIRPETGKEQKLLHINCNRIPLGTLMEWLERYLEQRPMVQEPRKISGTPDINGIKPWCKKILSEGVHNQQGGRNQSWMAIGCEMALNGFELYDTIDKLSHYFVEQSDFKQKEWETAVKSGWNYAYRIRRDQQEG